jgi:prephenate dehydratase
MPIRRGRRLHQGTGRPGRRRHRTRAGRLLYDLDIIENNVEDAADNTTRFVVLARALLDPATIEGTAMTTMIFEVRNVSAALYKALGGFATNGVNMTKLESYQRAPASRPRCFCRYRGKPGEEPVDRALEEVAFHCKDLRLLGSYAQPPARLSPTLPARLNPAPPARVKHGQPCAKFRRV